MNKIYQKWLRTMTSPTAAENFDTDWKTATKEIPFSDTEALAAEMFVSGYLACRADKDGGSLAEAIKAGQTPSDEAPTVLWEDSPEGREALQAAIASHVPSDASFAYTHGTTVVYVRFTPADGARLVILRMCHSRGKWFPAKEADDLISDLMKS